MALFCHRPSNGTNNTNNKIIEKYSVFFVYVENTWLFLISPKIQDIFSLSSLSLSLWEESEEIGQTRQRQRTLTVIQMDLLPSWPVGREGEEKSKKKKHRDDNDRYILHIYRIHSEEDTAKGKVFSRPNRSQETITGCGDERGTPNNTCDAVLFHET